MTNGVSPRRFLRLANPRLSALITARLGDERWLTDLDRLRELEAFADDAEFCAQWREVKRLNKLDLAAHALAATGVTIDPSSVFDVMVKRLHEYKRQLLKLLHVVTLYNRIKTDPAAAITPCTVIFAAKAAPSYQQAKRIIKLINSVASVVNTDPDVADRIKVVFLPDYNVSISELVVPAANISEQISLAGKEASGTGNMKLALNGAVTVGTLDGANIEIRDRVGAGNFFLFGLTADQAAALKNQGYSPAHLLPRRRRTQGSHRRHRLRDLLRRGPRGIRAGHRLTPAMGRVPGPRRLPLLHRLPRPGSGLPGPIRTSGPECRS